MTLPDDATLMLRLTELVLAASVAELLWLLGRSRARGAPAGLLPNLLAGLSLAAALRLSLGGAGVAWVAACLGAAGLCHLADLRARWPQWAASPSPGAGPREGSPP